MQKNMNLHNEKLHYRNPGTSADLVIGMKLISPVTKDVLHGNILKNQERDIPWLVETPAHDGVAIICGAGPSLADTLDEITSLNGQIFACNSAANYLLDQGIDVDYQVMLDPNPIRDCDFADTKGHLLASIVDSRMFEKSRNPVLWHPNIENIDSLVKPKDNTVFIGGGVTVGNSALCLAYTMGYRNLHVFGFDSSHREGKSHAASEHGEDGFAVLVENNGKRYPTTFDMKTQVVIFLELHRQLTQAGCKIEVYGSGLLPDIFTAN